MKARLKINFGGGEIEVTTGNGLVHMEMNEITGVSMEPWDVMALITALQAAMMENVVEHQAPHS